MSETDKGQTREDVTRLISGAMRPFDEQTGVARATTGGRPGAAGAHDDPNARPGKLRALMNPENILIGVSLLLALGFVALAASNISLAGSFLTIDSLFLTVTALTLAGIFMIIPALTLYEKGMLKNPFALGDDAGYAAADAHEELHVSGSTKLFAMVLLALLLLTLVEVLLAYFEMGLVLMLTILLGLSLIKAAMIMAYFMHLRFERLSLVLTLIPMLVVCICLFFVLFPDGNRSRNLRGVKSLPPPAAAASTEEAAP